MGDNPEIGAGGLRVRWGTSPMVVGAIAADHPGMTTEQPTAPRLLRRRGDDRVLGGVASGLADYFNVDPLLVRIGFVGLMVFNGLGLGLYLLAWLLVPTDTDNQSVVQRIIGRIGAAGALVLGLVALAVILVFNVPSRVVEIDGGGPTAPAASSSPSSR